MTLVAREGRAGARSSCCIGVHDDTIGREVTGARTASKKAFHDRWAKLGKMPKRDTRMRGYALEKLLCDLFEAEGLKPLPPLRSKSEPIGALFEHNGRFFQVKCKWLGTPPAASEVTRFVRRVEGKLAGTLGVFISATGFPAAIGEVLRYGKQINLLLFDGDDILHALGDAVSFANVLDVKLRRAEGASSPSVLLRRAKGTQYATDSRVGPFLMPWW